MWIYILRMLNKLKAHEIKNIKYFLCCKVINTYSSIIYCIENDIFLNIKS